MTTQAGRRLTEAHRLAQNRLGAVTVARFHELFPLLDPYDLDNTFDRWFRAVTPVVQGQRNISTRITANYLTTFSALEGGVTIDVVRALPVAAETLKTSMLVTGPISIKRARARGVAIERAVATADRASSAAGLRHALNGSRETITATTRADPNIAGWQRVTSGNACHFCDLLAGRGAVYGEASADFECHDGCSCSAEPVLAGT